MIRSLQPIKPVQLNINDWIQQDGETFAYVELSTIPIGSLFYEIQGGYIYSPYHVDDGYSVICDVVGLVDSDDLVKPVLPGSTYSLDKRLMIIPMKDTIRFMSKLWKNFYDENSFEIISQFSNLIVEKDKQIAELRDVVNHQIQTVRQLSSCDPSVTT